MSDSITLYGDSLLSKWGFGDGDMLGDWWWDHFDQDFPADEHAVLRDLVRTHLVPAIEAAGIQLSVFDIETIHNPIRAEVVNGEEVDHYNGDATFEPQVDVSVPVEAIWDAIGRWQRSEIRGVEDKH